MNPWRIHLTQAIRSSKSHDLLQTRMSLLQLFLFHVHAFCVLFFSRSLLNMSSRTMIWKSIACSEQFESDFDINAPPPVFDANDLICDLERKFRVHKSDFIIVNVEMLTGWRYIRRPHKAVIQKLIRLMKVCRVYPILCLCSVARSTKYHSDVASSRGQCT